MIFVIAVCNSSRFQFLLVRLKDSSPYEAFAALIEFQFLLVRLKVRIRNVRRWTIISIPSGTIKSVNGNFNIREFLKFQFLLVRLKVNEIEESLSSWITFQFLLVRLKESLEFEEMANRLNFNSFWYD